jgi:outer membrane protein insertion porin family
MRMRCTPARAALAVLMLLSLDRPAPCQVLVASITFEGNRAVDAGRLRAQMRILRAGRPYQPEALEYDLEMLRQMYLGEGFLRATVGPAQVEPEKSGNSANALRINIPISEGAVYTLGENHVRGNEVFPAETIMMLCPLRRGQPYSRRMMDEWRQKVAEGYHELGYLRFEATVREDIIETAHVVDSTLLCTEGKTFKVGKILLAGDEAIDVADFKRHILIGEGAPYNPEMIPLTLQLLNQAGIYRPILPSQVEIRIDDSSGTVDLVFHVSRNKR